MNKTRTDPKSSTLERAIAHYLATGEADPLGQADPGANILDRLKSYERHLRSALFNEVRRREAGRQLQPIPADFIPFAWIRRKLQTMIAGLFPAAERRVLLSMAERSVVFLTPENTHHLIHETSYLETAWTLANIYLYSLRLPRLGDSRPIVGVSLETKCYVSMEYFAEKGPLEDYVVHEVAHIFHNCKRRTLGLPHTRTKQWLLEIAFAKRETFAYACEAYSRILEQTSGKSSRQTFLNQHSSGLTPADDGVDRTELRDILAEAVQARNGWKHILCRCSKPAIGSR